MKYKVGDILVCQVEVRPNRAKKILMGVPAADATVIECAYQVIAKDETMQTYMLLIDSDMTGWTVGAFHVAHGHVAKVFLNKKFWDLPEQFVIKKK